MPSRSEAEWSAEDADVMGELRSRPGYRGPPRALEWPTLGELSQITRSASQSKYGAIFNEKFTNDRSLGARL